MTPDELQSALVELGWRKKELGERLGKTPKAVSGWFTGAVAVPKYVEAFVAQSLRLRRLCDGIGDP